MDSKYKVILRSILPDALLRKVRSHFVIKKHRLCKMHLKGIEENISDQFLAEIKPMKEIIGNKRIIWQYWGQGFDSNDVPDLIKICLKSVELNTSGYNLIRVSDKNVHEFLEIPKWLKDIMSNMSKPHYSDLIRCLLLSKYGGLWLDAAVFLTGAIPEYIFKNSFFIYRRDDSEKNKKYWEGTFAYYFGWNPAFLVRSLIGIMYVDKNKCDLGHKVVSDFASMLIAYWRNNDNDIDYFFFQILIEQYLKSHPELMPDVVNDTIPHLLRQYINEKPVPGYSIEDILNETTCHSLNYKNDKACTNLLKLFPQYRIYLRP